MNALAIFNKDLSIKEINDIYEHFVDIKFKLDPRYAQVADQIALAKSDIDCPFSDNTVCNSHCKYITDWRNKTNILNNDKCFKEVIGYCKPLGKTYTNDKMCHYFDEENILKSAAKINGYTTDTIASEIDSEEELVKQLRKIGIKNIYLDKSLRSKGKYADEINQLIDEIYRQRQISSQGIEDLYDADSEDLTIAQLEYDKLLTDKNQPTIPDVVIDRSDESEDLKIVKLKDLESYDEIMEDYTSSKKIEKQKEKEEEKGLFSKLTSWF